MKNMKRIIALAMVFLLLLTSACTGNQNSKADTSKAESSKAESSKADSSKADASTPSETSTPEEPTGPEPYELPIVANKVTLTMFSVLDGKASVSLSSMEENFTVQYYEELSNVHIQFFHPSSATSLTEALNTMIASGEIAATLAFSSQAYFQTVFKKETGMTPGEYRKKHSVSFRGTV